MALRDVAVDDQDAEEPVVHGGAVRRARRFVRRLGPAGPLAVIGALVPPIGAACLLGTLTLIAPTLRDVRAAPLICVIAFAILGGLAVLPTYAYSILAGWCFGFVIGFPTALTGIVCAALVGYAVARRASGQRLVQIIDERPGWRAVHGELLGSGFWRAVWIISLLRVAPVPPFALTNLGSGAAHVRVGRFVVGTMLGMSPQAAMLALGAASVEPVSFDSSQQAWSVALGAIALVVLLFVVGRLARLALANEVARHDARVDDVQVP